MKKRKPCNNMAVCGRGGKTTGISQRSKATQEAVLLKVAFATEDKWELPVSRNSGRALLEIHRMILVADGGGKRPELTHVKRLTLSRRFTGAGEGMSFACRA